MGQQVLKILWSKGVVIREKGRGQDNFVSKLNSLFLYFSIDFSHVL